jgi:hypothetical protein
VNHIPAMMLNTDDVGHATTPAKQLWMITRDYFAA